MLNVAQTKDHFPVPQSGWPNRKAGKYSSLLLLYSLVLTIYQALIYIRNEPEYADLRLLPYGVIFFGTPHAGSGLVSIGSIISNIARVFLKHPNKKLLSQLEKDSDSSFDLTLNFRAVHPELKIVSLYEQLPMSLGLVSGWRSIC